MKECERILKLGIIYIYIHMNICMYNYRTTAGMRSPDMPRKLYSLFLGATERGPLHFWKTPACFRVPRASNYYRATRALGMVIVRLEIAL